MNVVKMRNTPAPGSCVDPMDAIEKIWRRAGEDTLIAWLELSDWLTERERPTTPITPEEKRRLSDKFLMAIYNCQGQCSGISERAEAETYRLLEKLSP